VENTAWSLNDIIKKLCEATSILLHEKNYDADGWELINTAFNLAEKYLADRASEEIMKEALITLYQDAIICQDFWVSNRILGLFKRLGIEDELHTTIVSDSSRLDWLEEVFKKDEFMNLNLQGDTLRNAIDKAMNENKFTLNKEK